MGFQEPITLFLVFWGTCIPFSIAAAPIYIKQIERLIHRVTWVSTESQMHDAEQNMLDRKDHTTYASISMNFLEKRPQNIPDCGTSWLQEVVQFSCSVLSDSLWPQGLQHSRPPCPSPTPGIYSNSCQLSRWCHPTNSSSVISFSRLQSFPTSNDSVSNESGSCIWDLKPKSLAPSGGCLSEA